MAENLAIGGDQPVMLQSYQSKDGKPLNMWLGNEGGENYKVAEEIYLSPNQIAAMRAKSKMAITKEGNTVARSAAPDCETYNIDTHENNFYYANAYDESIGNVTVQRIHRTITMTVCHPGNDFNSDYYLPVTGSEGGGGGYDSPNSISQIIKNNLKNPCLSSSLNSVMINNFKSTLSSILNNIFKDSKIYGIEFIETTSLPDFQNGETRTVLDEDISGGLIKATFTIALNVNTLPNTTREYIARTLFHEFLHAYLNYTGQYGTLKNHNNMANQFINEIASALKANFPGMSDFDARSLAWGGLQDTDAWAALQESNLEEANNLRITDAQYRLGETKGTKCN
ncbi:MAG: hypothetical protein IPH58_06545 [Sphingobacteriales bacterium]|jgi:hypothetical protein|nr:hypothetical protein [Sphingobacteriales bacterium]